MGCPNYSEDEWLVALHDGTVTPSRRTAYKSGGRLPVDLAKFQEERGRKVYLQLDPHSWLLGTDDGEFGGGLWLIKNAGPSELLLSDNVHGIIGVDGGAYILTGLAHLTMDEGQLYFFPTQGSPRELRKVGDLGSAPAAFAEEDAGSFLIVTQKALLRLKKNGSLETLHDRYLGLLYPTSVVRDEAASVYIGMRFFVLKLLPSGIAYTEEWLVPNRCRKFKIKNYSCVCTAPN